MTNRSWVKGIMLAAVLTGTCRPEIGTPIEVSDELRITVYNEASLAPEVVRDALDRVRLILQSAKIISYTVVGNPADPEASLFVYSGTPTKGPEPGNACGARRDIALKIIGSSPKTLGKSMLGISSAYAVFGLNVKLFDDHIREAARQHDVPHAIVLSYAMAHEIGHVLLRRGFHGRRGIMSAIWTKREYEQISSGLFSFSGEEAKTMSANLRVPVCAGPGRRPTWVDR